MKITNDLSKKYSKPIIRIHWISLVFILALIPSGLIMADMKNSSGKLLLYRLHLLWGFNVFILTLFRCWFFFKSPRPPKLETGSRFHNKLVLVIEYSFYWVLILLSVSGISTILSTGLFEIIRNGNYNNFTRLDHVAPLAAHRILAKILFGLLLAHIVGVINHYITRKENTLKRILP